MPLGDAAMLYAIRGWPVFPLIGKVPAVRSGHGYKDATTDIVQVCEWWAKYPDANIGIATGAAGLVVIDPDKEGDKAWRELAHRLMLPQTLMAYTGGGGMHVYFVAPSSPRVGNSAGKLLPHVDVRGWGGYIVLPPSIHPDTGKRYAWIPHTQLSICPLPKPLLKMLFPPPAPSRRVTVTDSINPDWWLKGRTFREGERNWCLYQTACSIVNHVQSLDELVSLTLAVNDARCIPPLPEAEARQVAHNASAFL
jgi:hypothetical protein